MVGTCSPVTETTPLGSTPAAETPSEPSVCGTSVKLTVALAPGASDVSGQTTSAPLLPPPTRPHAAPVELTIAPCNCAPNGVARVTCAWESNAVGVVLVAMTVTG